MCTDKDNLRQIILDAVSRRRAKPTAEKEHSEGDTAKNIKDLIDAALMLKLSEDTVIADLLTFFIGGFHTSASCKSTDLSLAIVLLFMKSVNGAVLMRHITEHLQRRGSDLSQVVFTV